MIAAAAGALRAGLTAALLGDEMGEGGDIRFFHWAANLIADGRGYIAPYTLQLTGDVRPTAEHPPLWPHLLGLVSELGGTSVLAHRLVGCAVGALTVAAVGLLARRVAGDAVGLTAAGLAACYPLFLAADGSLMSEPLYGLAIAVALIAVLGLLDRPSGRSALGLGLVVGVAALIRGEGLLLLPLLALPAAVLAAPGGRLRRAGLVLAGAALVIAPWTARNWARFDQPVLVSTNDSTVLVGANCEATYRGRDLGYWRDDCRTTIRERNEAELAARYRREGLSYAADHAGRLPAVLPVRVLRTWGVWQPRRQAALAEGRHRRLEQAGVVAFFLLLPLAARGALALRPERGKLLVLLAPAVLVTVTSLAAYGQTRFRHAFEISLVVLAALAIVRLAGSRRTAA